MERITWDVSSECVRSEVKIVVDITNGSIEDARWCILNAPSELFALRPPLPHLLAGKVGEDFNRNRRQNNEGQSEEGAEYPVCQSFGSRGAPAG